MGTGSLRRIAALSLLATIAVLAGGAVSVPAQLTVPSTTVTTPTVTVPSTTVRVPSTTTTVTTPTATTPKTTVTTPTVTSPAPKPPTQVSEPVEDVKKTVSGTTPTGSTDGTSGSGGAGDSLDAGGTVGGVTDSLRKSTAAAGSDAPSGGSLGSGPGGTSGGPGGAIFFGPGSAGGSSAGGGRSLAAMLAGASSKELRSVLEQLEGCLPALPAADRRLISMRAGLDGAPLSRSQAGRRLGLSPRAVRRTERRALNRLQFAAANTGCAASVVGPFDPAGIGNVSPQLVIAGAVPVGSGAGFTGDFAQARGIVGQSASPLFALAGGGGGGPAWAIVLFTVLLSVSVAALTREVRHSF